MTESNSAGGRIRDITRELVSSYGSLVPRMEHVHQPSLPDKAALIGILDDLLALLYPGFFGRKNLDAAKIESHVGDLLGSLSDRLAEEIFRARGSADATATREHARESAVALLGVLPSLRSSLASDVQAAFDGDPAATSADEVLFAYPGVLAVSIYRIAHAIQALSVPLLPRMMTEHAHSLTGIDIHPGATIGTGFFIDHGTGVVIGETAVIGNRVKLYQGVTLGALSFPRDVSGRIVRGTKRHPTLEDDVVIYAGATILGGDTVIGKGSVVGGNVWLTRSVPPMTKVMLAEPRLVIEEKA